MKLHRKGREWYALRIETTPAVTGWSASFDDGVTWHVGDPTTGHWRWLLAGPEFNPADYPAAGVPVVVLTESTAPTLRAVDDPEVIIESEDVPWIYLYG